MVILGCGSRSWTDLKTIEETFSQLNAAYGSPKFLIHGDAKGADKGCALIAKRLGWGIKAFPAEWDVYGTQAGILRNLVMLDQLEPTDLVVAFWDGKSRGTQHTITEANKRGLTVITRMAINAPTDSTQS